MTNASTKMPVIVLGAFDRHNFGDLLFPHITAAMLPERALVFAGLAERNMCSHGGHQVQALSRLATEWRDRPVQVLHAGGEILTCSAWEAAVMLLDKEQAKNAISQSNADIGDRVAWAKRQLGLDDQVPYMASRSLFPYASRVMYNGVGGVELDSCDETMRDEIMAKLKVADVVGVRDRRTHAQLGVAGIRAILMPDPAVMVAELCAKPIRDHAQQGPVKQMWDAFPQGYIAVQFSADFGDEATLAELGAQIEKVAAAHRLGVVFFLAGAAPWHDDIQCYCRAAAYMRHMPVQFFSSLHLWDICGLLAHCTLYCGSSLHGSIVSAAHRVPHVCLLHAGQLRHRSKQASYLSTWEEMPAIVTAQALADGAGQALASSDQQRDELAHSLVATYREGFKILSESL